MGTFQTGASYKINFVIVMNNRVFQKERLIPSEKPSFRAQLSRNENTKAKLKCRELTIFQVWLSRSLPITSLIWHCIQRANSIFQSELSANSTSITTLCASTTSLVRLLWQCLQSKTRFFGPASTSPSRPSGRIKEWRQ